MLRAGFHIEEITMTITRGQKLPSDLFVLVDDVDGELRMVLLQEQCQIKAGSRCSYDRDFHESILDSS